MSKNFIITHTFNVPRATMWRAWTEPQLFAKWFGPKGWSAQVHKLELKKGGIVHTQLTMPGGGELWGKFVYREITPQTRLVWEHSFSDKNEGITRHPFNAHWPLKLITTVSLEEQEGKTKVTLTWIPLDANEEELKSFEDELPGMSKGWGGTFEQLEAYLREKRAA